MEIWGSFPIEPQLWHRVEVGPYTLWIQRDKEEWRLVSDVREVRLPEPPGVQPPIPSGDPLPDKEMRRSIVSGASPEVAFAPIMPDLPVVVRPESSLQIAPGAEGVFFVSIPIWVRVSAGKTHPHVVLEEPTVRLSSTWFGSPETGVLCYGLRTKARRALDALPTLPHRCVCPVRVRNEASASFAFDRMCLQVEHLAVFQGQTRLWANPVHCVVKNLDEATQVEYVKKPPNYEPIVRELSPMRKPAYRGIFNSVFGSLWTSFTDF